jgi:hypothetical protein
VNADQRSVGDLAPGDRVDVGYGLGIRTVAEIDTRSAGSGTGGFIYDDDMVIVTWCEVSPTTGHQYGNTYSADDVVTVLR